ncbi:MAG: 50S ribosomal protein L4 [Nanoarchaeota archaeon]|nr:50S ribosomal protein L4 [Nanoarchaeota archaeon]
MKLDLVAKDLQKKGSMELPLQFNEPIRQDIIQRAVESEQGERRQRYGAKPKAGRRHSAYVSKRRRDYRTTYGIGQSRTPRKILSRHGTRLNWAGAVAPQTRGGRQSHPPKALKVWTKKVNKREMNLALRSAISATLSKELATKRGHKVPASYPFIVDSSIDAVTKTKDASAFLISLGLEADLERGQSVKIRAGKGKLRGRRYKTKKSALVVTATECPLSKSARNLPGVQVVTVDKLTVDLLAPGSMPGRLTIWTQGAVERLAKENLYL